jgi:hypothetical protein
MGSSDPLPPGFEIRFGSLNFQVTGNGYLMRITNRVERHPWRSTRPRPVPTMHVVGIPALAPPGAAGPSAPRHRRRSGQRSRRAQAERCRAARVAARRGAPLDATTLAEGFPHGICNAATSYTSSAGTDIAAYDDLPGYQLLAARNLIATDDESYHGSDSELPPRPCMGTRNGIFRRAGSGFFLVVPRRRGLLVRLL